MPGVPRGTFAEMPIMSSRIERVAVDIVDSLPLMKKRNAFLLTVVDTCLMWGEDIASPSYDTIRVVVALAKVFARLEFPNQILTDNGSLFIGKLI